MKYLKSFENFAGATTACEIEREKERNERLDKKKEAQKLKDANNPNRRTVGKLKKRKKVV